MMRKTRLIAFIVVLMLCIVYPAAAQQNPAFEVKTITIKNQPAYDLKVSADGQIAAIYFGQVSAVLQGVPATEYTVDESLLPIRLIDLSTGSEIGQLTGQTDYAADIAFTPDGKQLAAYLRNGEIYIWDIASQKKIKQITAILGGGRLKYLPDGISLLTYQTGTFGYFMLWDTDSSVMNKIVRPKTRSFGDIQLSKLPASLDYSVAAFDVSPDGKSLVTATPNGEIMLWDIATMDNQLIQKKAEKIGMFNVRSVLFSADGKSVIYYDTLSKQTHIWDIANRAETAALNLGEQFFVVSPQADLIAWTTRKAVSFARLDQPDSVTKILDFPDTLLVGIPTIAITPNGKHIVVGGFMSKADNHDNLIYLITLN